MIKHFAWTFSFLLLAFLLVPSTFYVEPVSAIALSSPQVVYPSACGLTYASIFDGYLWLVCTKSSNGAGPGYIEKRDITGNLVGKITPSRVWFEFYAVYAYSGRIYVPGDYLSQAYVEVYDEATLQELTCFAPSPSNLNVLIQVLFDPMHNKMLISGDMQDGTVGIYAVDPAQSGVNSAYYYIKIDNNPMGLSSENALAVFQNKVYVLSSCYAPHTTDTRLYSSSDLSTWTLVWSRVASNEMTGPYGAGGIGCFFPHITVKPGAWLVCGFFADSGGTRPTGHLMYWNGVGSWLECDTGIVHGSWENHLNVNMLSSTECLVEWSERNAGTKGKLYVFDCPTGILTYQLDLPTAGFSDRVVPMDPNGYIYVHNNRIYNSELVKIATTYTPPPESNGTLRVFASSKGVYVSAYITVGGLSGFTRTDPTNPLTFSLVAGTYTLSGTYNGTSNSTTVMVSSSQILDCFISFGGSPPPPPPPDGDFWTKILNFFKSLGIDPRLVFILLSAVCVIVVVVYAKKSKGGRSKTKVRTRTRRVSRDFYFSNGVRI